MTRVIGTPAHDHVELLHKRAAGIKGKLVVASYGQDPETGKDLTSKVGHFQVGDVEGTLRFIQDTSADKHRNIYMPLAVMRDILERGKKGTENEIVAVLGLCADFDAKDDPEVSRWEQRVPTEPSFVLETSTRPEPSFQVFFLFAKPLQRETVKPLAVTLAESCRCDHGTKDLSHVWRVPGLFNWPNKKKVVEHGRPKDPQQVVVVQPFKGRLVAPADLGDTSQSTGESVDLGNAELPSVDVDQLPVSDRIKHVIRHGVDPDDPDRYKTRSEALFAAVVAMAAKDCDDITIASVCMHRDNAISAHVWDQANPREYMERQIARGRQRVSDPQLAALNAKHAVIFEAGKTVVLTEDWDDVLGRRMLTRSSFSDFRNFYDNQEIVVGCNAKGHPIKEPLGSCWLKHPKRRQYEGVVFAPGKEVPGRYNLWKGFGVEPKPGEWPLMRDHILHVICASDDKLFEYVMGWMAKCVQQPGQQGEVALVLRGKRGTGKGMFAWYFGFLFGQHFVHISNSRHLVGHFNLHLEDAVVLFADEAFWAGDKQGEGVLKMLITEHTITIEPKYQNPRPAKNVIHLMIASNSDWVVPSGLEERRFCVFDVSEAHMQDRDYFGKLVHERDNGGREAMLYDLQNYDLSSFDVRVVPQTEGLREQKIFSMGPHEKWWYEKLMNGQLLPDHDGWEVEARKSDLHKDYTETMGKAGVRHRAIETELGIHLSKLLPDGYPRTFKRWEEVATLNEDGQPDSEDKQVRYWEFPPLAKCREHFDQITKTAQPWPDEEDERQQGEATPMQDNTLF